MRSERAPKQSWQPRPWQPRRAGGGQRTTVLNITARSATQLAGGRHAASPRRGARMDLSRPQGCHGRLGAGGHVSQGRVVHAHAGSHGGRQCQALPERALGARRPVGVDRLLRTPTAQKCTVTHLLVLCGWDAVKRSCPPPPPPPPPQITLNLACGNAEPIAVRAFLLQRLTCCREPDMTRRRCASSCSGNSMHISRKNRLILASPLLTSHPQKHKADDMHALRMQV